MKTEKLSLKGIKNVLSRAELKKIMAGSGGGGGCLVYGATCCIGTATNPCNGAPQCCTGTCWPNAMNVPVCI